MEPNEPRVQISSTIPEERGVWGMGGRHWMDRNTPCILIRIHYKIYRIYDLESNLDFTVGTNRSGVLVGFFS